MTPLSPRCCNEVDGKLPEHVGFSSGWDSLAYKAEELRTEIPNTLDFYHPATYSKKSRPHFQCPSKVEGSQFRSDAQVYCAGYYLRRVKTLA